jgi:hypothetical protein
LASDLLGACVIACMDYWLEHALEHLRNPEASPAWRRADVNWQKDEAARRLFSALSPEQRAAVEKQLFDTVFGVVHSVLAKLDQFPNGVADISVRHLETQETMASVYEGDILDLHDRLFGWIERFSNHAPAFLREP